MTSWQDFEFVHHEQSGDYCVRCNLAWPCTWALMPLGIRHEGLWREMFDHYAEQLDPENPAIADLRKPMRRAGGY